MKPKAMIFYDFLSDLLENKKVYAESFDDDELDRVDKENTKSACIGTLTEDFDDFTSSINRTLDKILEEK